MNQRAWEVAMGMRGYAGSPAQREDRELRQRLDDEAQDILDLVGLVRESGRRGMTSADVTRLRGRNEYRLLAKAERLGALKSNPTGMRSRGRRWFAAEFAPEPL